MTDRARPALVAGPTRRLALGISYFGHPYQGWQSQSGGRTVQDHLETALSKFADVPVQTWCAGRTDAGVHAVNQVVHIEIEVEREPQSWVRGTNRYLPDDIALQWCHPVEAGFHARFSALGRRYAYLLRESPVRPSLDAARVGWSYRPLNGEKMREAAACLLGEHDFSAFRSSQCQAKSPVKTLRALEVSRCGAYWRFDFEASAFLHHMVRNLMGCLVAVGQGRQNVSWMSEVLEARRRSLAAPTFSAAGLYFLGPYYDARHGIPTQTAEMDWLPR